MPGLAAALGSVADDNRNDAALLKQVVASLKRIGKSLRDDHMAFLGNLAAQIPDAEIAEEFRALAKNKQPR
jgi:hypothetical protein